MTPTNLSIGLWLETLRLVYIIFANSVCINLCRPTQTTCLTGVETKFKGAFYEALLSVSHVPELNRVREEEERGLLVGAAVPLNTLKTSLTAIVGKLPGNEWYIPNFCVCTVIIYIASCACIRIQNSDILCSARDVEMVCWTADTKYSCEIISALY